MHKHRWRTLVFSLGISALTPVIAQAAPASIQLRTQQTYTVKPGDTLWGIAGHFLVHPWQWPQIWHKNPYIKNPNLIYPGDRIVLRYGANGEPELSLESPFSSGSHFVELRPQMTSEPVPSVSTGEVMPFLGSPGVIASKKDFAKLPYLAAAAKQRPTYVTGNTLYTVGLKNVAVGKHFQIVALGPELFQAKTHRSLGFALEDLGEVTVTQSGHHAAVQITKVHREIDLGERLVPMAKTAIPHYFPSAPQQSIEGHIIAQLESNPALTVGQVVVIDQGSDNELKLGNILQIQRGGAVARNAVTGKPFALPAQTIGSLMVFRLFPHVSYAVITTASRDITVGDEIHSPGQTTASAAK
ncbi:peptidoglycan-binding protein LysM [Acidithiobacillus marinus]|uniref:Peptidoglycan-binding protein LysM n=1 Tax=Acidithiobacillus marinus TaxID=187490 RepID=A0A2I1DI34_9PROT|nr:LysM domain-containing protein [Acidithiobacillus marinus]PKY09533.1 peptidoglycan-binding protein LysM [Acidithiobacillus marinus]